MWLLGNTMVGFCLFKLFWCACLVAVRHRLQGQVCHIWRNLLPGNGRQNTFLYFRLDTDGMQITFTRRWPIKKKRFGSTAPSQEVAILLHHIMTVFCVVDLSGFHYLKQTSGLGWKTEEINWGSRKNNNNDEHWDCLQYFFFASSRSWHNAHVHPNPRHANYHPIMKSLSHHCSE